MKFSYINIRELMACFIFEIILLMTIYLFLLFNYKINDGSHMLYDHKTIRVFFDL